MARKKKTPANDRKQISSLNTSGHEIPDSVPLATSLGARRARSIRDNVVDILRSEKWREAMEASGEETFEEADDFDIDDDFDPSTPYEEFFEGEYTHLRNQRLEMQKTETQKARRGRQAAPRDAEKSAKAVGKEISDGAAPSRPKGGAASKEISDGESPA